MDGQIPAGTPADATKAPGPPLAAMPAPAAPPPAGPIKLRAAVKAMLAAAIGPMLDHVAAAGEMIAGAEIDETAEPMPAALLAHLVAADDALDEALGPYDMDDEQMAAPPVIDPAQKAAVPPPPGAPPPPGVAAPAGTAETPAGKPPRPRPRMAIKRLAAMADVHKAMDDGCKKLGDLIGWAQGAGHSAAPGMAPTGKAEVDPYTALTMTIRAAKDRMYGVRDLLDCENADPGKIAQAVDGLKQIIAMLDSAGALAQPGGALPMPGMIAPAQAAAPAVDPAAMQKAATEALKAASADLLASLKADLAPILLDAKSAAARAQAALTKVEKSVAPPQGASAGENIGTPPQAPPPADPWASINQDIAQARQPAAGK